MRFVKVLLYFCCLGAAVLYIGEWQKMTKVQNMLHNGDIAIHDLNQVDHAIVNYMSAHQDKVPYEMNDFVEVMHSVNADSIRFIFPFVNVVGQPTYTIKGAPNRGWRGHAAPLLTITRYRDHGRDGRPEMGAGILYVGYTVDDYTWHKLYHDNMSQQR